MDWSCECRVFPADKAREALFTLYIASLLTGVRNWERTSGIRKRLVQSNDAEKKTLAGERLVVTTRIDGKGAWSTPSGCENTRRRSPVWRCPWDLRCAVQKDKVHQQEQIDPATTTRCAQLPHTLLEVTISRIISENQGFSTVSECFVISFSLWFGILRENPSSFQIEIDHFLWRRETHSVRDQIDVRISSDRPSSPYFSSAPYPLLSPVRGEEEEETGSSSSTPF